MVFFTNSFFKHLLCAGFILGAGDTVMKKVDEVGENNKHIIMSLYSVSVGIKTTEKTKAEKGDRKCHGLG